MTVSSRAKYLLSFAAGIILALAVWELALRFVRDKPVPNAIFTQSIVDSKLRAAERKTMAPKAVFVGGSNVLFGIDSEQFTRETHYPSLNFGCASGMGPELILDLLLPYLNKGDLVVLHWEYGHYGFTRSGSVDLTYLNLLSGPQASFKDRLPWLDRRLLSLAVPFSQLRSSIETSINPYVDSGIYSCAWVIDDGGNVRSNIGRTITKEELSERSLSSLVSELEISSDAGNIFVDFVRQCCDRGIRVIASWPNLYAHPDYFGNEVVDGNLLEIRGFWESLGVPVVGDPRDSMLAAEFFYDTSYHLNAKGVSLRTRRLGEALGPWIGQELKDSP